MPLAFSNTVVTQVSDFEHNVAQITERQLLDSTGLVIRVDAQLWLDLVGNSELTSRALQAQVVGISRRAPRIDVYVIPDGHSFAEARPAFPARHGPRLLTGKNRAGLIFAPVNIDKLNEIRQADLQNCIEVARARCVICAATNYHFELPSGAHASQFLRLAEAFVDIETVDRIAYWIALQIQANIPLLRDNNRYALMVDHPSMLILAARVQLLVTVHLEVVAFHTYPSDVETRSGSFDLLRRVSSRCSTVFVLIGVASTGRFANFIKRWAQESRVRGIHVSVLYSVQSIENVYSFCHLNLPGYQHFESVQACSLCDAQSATVRIQTSNYLVGNAPAEAVALLPRYFEEQRSFIDRWGGYEGVLRVHYDDPNDSVDRHHAFYVDVDALLENAAFVAEMLETVRAFDPRPDVVLVPFHSTALRIGELVSGDLQIPLVSLDSELLARGVGALNSELLVATYALVVDDVFITGSRFDAINRFIRENRGLRAPTLNHIRYWTLLATPSSSLRYGQACRGLTGNHGWTSTLGHLYKFSLPDWHESKDCPWCRESVVLKNLAQASGDFDGLLGDRLTQLGATKSGLCHMAYFLPNPEIALPNLGAESVALSEGATPLQVLFACASAVQQLRSADRASLNADQFPAPSYLAVRVFASNFTERIIWLGILRALKGKELEPALKTYLSVAALDESDGQRQFISGELAVAWVTGKLSAIEVSNGSKVFFQSAGMEWQALFHNGLVDRDPTVM